MTQVSSRLLTLLLLPGLTVASAQGATSAGQPIMVQPPQMQTAQASLPLSLVLPQPLVNIAATSAPVTVPMVISRPPEKLDIAGFPAGMTLRPVLDGLEITTRQVKPGKYPVTITATWGKEKRWARLQITVLSAQAASKPQPAAPTPAPTAQVKPATQPKPVATPPKVQVQVPKPAVTTVKPATPTSATTPVKVTTPVQVSTPAKVTTPAQPPSSTAPSVTVTTSTPAPSTSVATVTTPATSLPMPASIAYQAPAQAAVSATEPTPTSTVATATQTTTAIQTTTYQSTTYQAPATPTVQAVQPAATQTITYQPAPITPIVYQPPVTRPAVTPAAAKALTPVIPPAQWNTQRNTGTRPSVAQASASNRLTLWGGLTGGQSSGLSVGLSAPVAQKASTRFSVRGTAELYTVASNRAALGADLLLSRASNTALYYGPSTTLLPGQGWGVGGLLGYAAPLGQGALGYYLEGRARYLKLGSSGSLAPDLKVGLTFRF